VKRLFWILAMSIVLLGNFSKPPQLTADGNPMPSCPTGKVGCKTTV